MRWRSFKKSKNRRKIRIFELFINELIQKIGQPKKVEETIFKTRFDHEYSELAYLKARKPRKSSLNWAQLKQFSSDMRAKRSETRKSKPTFGVAKRRFEPQRKQERSEPGTSVAILRSQSARVFSLSVRAFRKLPVLKMHKSTKIYRERKKHDWESWTHVKSISFWSSRAFLYSQVQFSVRN